MKNYSWLFLLTFFTVDAAAQTKDAVFKKKADSIKMHYLEEAALRYPVLRQAATSLDITGRGNIKARLFGKELLDAKAQTTLYRANFNIPVASWGKNKVSVAMSVLHQHIDLDHVALADAGPPVSDLVTDKTTLAFFASYTRTDSLFNRPFIFSGSVAGITDDLSSIKRVNYLGSIITPLKRTATTAYSIGLLAVIDPSSPLPVFPFFSYWHKFKTPGLELFADLPSRVSLRKSLSASSWLSFGTSMTGNLAFLNGNQPPLPRDAIYTNLELKTGPSFEHLVARKLVLGISGGIYSSLSSRLFQHDKSSNDYFARTSNNVVPYINFSLSLLPFL